LHIAGTELIIQNREIYSKEKASHKELIMQMPSNLQSACEKLLIGSETLEFENMGLNLLVFNLKNRVAFNEGLLIPSTQKLMNFLQDNESLPKIRSAISMISELSRGGANE
jgi:hypothetical protein